jgi:pimeloyl-ACP methyl ester carboxylesterase
MNAQLLKQRALFGITIVVSAALLLAQEQSGWRDSSPHRVHFVHVGPNVSLEVLDWGGSGRAMILLSGLGGTAHSFDDFAPKLTGLGHVFGITRRGFGGSSAPDSGYEADRLGDDVLAVMESLEVSKPVLVGESLGGEELSSVGSRYPDRLSGLVYLDAAYPYAFDNGKGSTLKEIQESAPAQPNQSAADRASFRALQDWYSRIVGVTLPEAELRQMFNATPEGRVGAPRTSPRIGDAIFAGIQKYTEIRAPALAIFAVPHSLGPWYAENPDPDIRRAIADFSAKETALTEKQVTAFEEGVPSARVVRLPHANHLVFASNEADVLREMRAFLASLN